MTKQHNRIFYITYANVTCRVSASLEWSKYFKKLYEPSNILIYSDKSPKLVHTAFLTIKKISSSSSIKLEFISNKDHKTFEIRASDTPIFFFPSAHQLISRILNIVFHLSGGFVLHASSIYVGGDVLLFVGESGRGKSTIVDLIHSVIPQSYILSDNSAFIRQIKGNFVLYPSPYLEANRLGSLQATLPSTSPYKISHVYFPYHAFRNRIVPLTLNDKIRLIQKNSHIPYKPETLFTRAQITTLGNTIFRFVKTVDIKRLEFVKNKLFIYHIL